MTQFATNSYIQARLQARHGNRPDEHTWQRLAMYKELAGYLQNARRTVLRPWVLSFHEHDNYHVLESTLIKLYRSYIDEVASWHPQTWRQAVYWIKKIPDLPALQYLLTGNTVQSWMLDDARLKRVSATDPERRFEYMEQSEYAPIVRAWQSGTHLPEAWVQHWQNLWPEKNTKITLPMIRLIALLYKHLEVFRQTPLSWTLQKRQALIEQLTHMFRKYNFQPVTTFVHLSLIALDLERLRGEIMRRRLFGKQ